MRIVILGCGRVGSTLAKMMAAEDHDVTVIDQTSESFRRLGTKFKGTRLVGPGTDVDVLRRAGIESADVFVSVTDGDNRNIMAAQIAKDVFNVPRVVTRIYDPSRARAYGEMGIHTICTTSIAAGLIHDIALDRPSDLSLDDLDAYRDPAAAA
jgi:trk system potassium uptake protein TrkA